MSTAYHHARIGLAPIFLAAASFSWSVTADAQCMGSFNTCFGDGALISNTTGAFNSAFGAQALEENTTARNNSAFGYKALEQNIAGENNTAVGFTALLRNTSGHINTAVGALSMQLNTTGIGNTALGFQALQLNTIGGDNTAVGAQALQENETGERNTVIGSTALFANASGSDNTAAGSFALFLNTVGNSNSAYGANSLRENTTGIQNTASGVGSMRNNASGFRNVAVGYQAGAAITGSDNILIGGNNRGKASDNGVIRIGIESNQKKTFVAGIRGVTTGLANASAVFIDGNGQLGTIKSSRAVKEDIAPVGEFSDRIYALEPVSFRYKEPFENGTKPTQIGLIAEDVAAKLPELVVYNEDGKPETVAYHLLPTLLLNELKKQHATVEAQAARIADLELRLEKLLVLEQRLESIAARASIVDKAGVIAQVQ